MPLLNVFRDPQNAPYYGDGAPKWDPEIRDFQKNDAKKKMPRETREFSDNSLFTKSLVRRAFFFLKKSENQFTNNKCDLGERAKSLNRLFQCYLVCFSDPKNRIPVAIQLEATAIIKAI